MISRAILVVVTAACLAAPAAAQVLPKSNGLFNRTLFNAGSNYLGRSRHNAGFGVGGRDRADPNAVRRECLTQKKTGRVFCLTRSEWEAIASGNAPLPD